MDNTHKNNITKTASANMSKGTVVKLDAADSAKVVATAATDANAIGVVLDDVKQGDNVAVALLGIANHTVETLASAAIAVGTQVCLGANGKVAPLPAPAAAAQNVLCVGVALTPSYADGNIVELAHRAPTILTIAAA